MQKRLLLAGLILCLSLRIVTAADYYWVGGSGNWDDLSHWATTSGGQPLHTQIPTALDNVYFDANSFTTTGQTVTLNVSPALCHNMDWTGAQFNPTLAGNNTFLLKVYGSLTVINNMNISFTGNINMEATNTGKTLRTNGKVLNNHIYFIGNGGGWTLQDSLSLGSNKSVYLQYGSLNTNGYKVKSYYFSSDVSNVRTLILGSSLIEVTAPSSSAFALYLSNLTLNAGTSLIRCSGASGTSGGGVYLYDSYNNLSGSLYDVEFTYASGTSTMNVAGTTNASFHDVRFYGNGNINGSSTYTNLILGAGKNFVLQNGKTQTILNSLTINPAGSCNNITSIQSSTNGSFTTISKSSGSVTLDYVSLRDIHATGGAVFTANNSSDLGNNTGWTINAPVPRSLYWVGGSGNWNDQAHWSLSSGGSGGQCIPGPTDDVFFDANSFSAPGQSVNINVSFAVCRDMTWTGALYNPSITGVNTNVIKIYGSLTLINAMSVPFTGNINFEATTTGKTIRTASLALSNHFYFLGSGGGWTLLDSVTLVSNKSVYFQYGSLNTNSQNVSCYYFSSDVSNPRTLLMGSSRIRVTAPSSSAFALYVSNLTLNAGTSLIQCTGASGTSGGGIYVYDSYNNLSCSLYDAEFTYVNGTSTMNVAGTTNASFNNVRFFGNGNINGNVTYTNLQLAAGKLFVLQNAKTQTILNSLTIVPAGSCNNITIIQSSTNGQFSTISKTSGSITIDYVILRDVHATGGAVFTASNSTDLGNNNGWIFTSPPSRTLYWVGGTGNWNDQAHWSLSSGGPGGQCIPGPTDDVFFDANSFSGSGQSVNINISYALCRDMTWTGAQYNPTVSGANTNSFKIYGSLTLINAMNISFTGNINFESTTTGKNINTAGKVLSNHIYFLGSSGGWILQDSLSLSSNKSVYHQYGSLNTNNHKISCYYFSSDVSNPRVLILGSSIINVTAPSSSAFALYLSNLTLNGGTSLIRASGASGTSGGGVYIYDSYNNLSGSLYDVEFTYANGTSTMNVAGTTNASFHNVTFWGNGNINGNSSYNNLTFTAGYTYIMQNGKTQTISGNLLIQGSCTSYIILQSSTLGNFSTFHKTSGTVMGYNIHMRDIKAQGGATFYAYNSVDLGGNSGWQFTTLPVLANPQNISGPNALCIGQNGIQYSIPPVSGAISYTWTVPAGVQIVSGQGDTLITVNISTAVNGDIEVIAFNGCNGSLSSVLTLVASTVNLQAFSGSCISAAPVALSGGSPPGGTYWGTGVVNNVFDPSVAGIGSHTIYYAYTAGACADTVSQTMTVYSSPSVNLNNFPNSCLNGSPISLSGGTPSGGTYSGTGVTGGIFDPATAGLGTHNIVYSYQDQNGCQGTDTATIFVTNAPTLPLAPIGPDSICQGTASSFFNTSSPDATSYSWSVSPSAAGSVSSVGSNATVIWNTAYNGSATVSVQATNSCGTSVPVSSTVVITTTPGPPSAISGLNSLCSGTASSVYSTSSPGATGYIWSLSPASAGSVSGNGSSATVYWDPAYTGQAVVSVAAFTLCDTTATTSMNVTLTPLPGTLIFHGGNGTVCQGTASSLYSAVCQFATGFIWTLSPPQAGSISGTGPTSTILWDTTFIGTATITVWAFNACDTVGPASMPVIVVPSPAQPVITVNGTLLSSTPASTYAWHFNGVAINGATTQQYNATQTGNYFVVVQNSYGCSDTSETVFISIITGIDETNEGLVSIYPNPANESVNIVFNRLQHNADIAIYDLSGKMIFNTSVAAGEHNGMITLSRDAMKISAGMYILRLRCGTLDYHEKLIFNR